MIITVSKVKNIEDFDKVQSSLELTPYGGAAAFILALNFYQTDKTNGYYVVKKSLTGVAINGGEMLENEKFRMDEQLKRYPQIANAYFMEASPENNYEVGDNFLNISFKTASKEDLSKKRVKLFVKTNGADSDRPISLEKTLEGKWRVVEFSSLLSGVKTD